MKNIIPTLLTVALGLFAGCSTIEGNPTLAKGVVQFAAFELFEQSSDPLDTAENTYYIADQLLELSDANTTAEAVASLVRAEVAKLNLSAHRQALADILIITLQDHITARIDAGQLDSSELLAVQQVASWVREAAEVYVDRGAQTAASMRLPPL